MFDLQPRRQGRWGFAGWLLGVGAMLAGPGHASEVAHTMVDGACVYMKQNNIKVNVEHQFQDPTGGDLQSMFQEGMNQARNWVDGKSPMCQIETPAAVLLVTADYIDRAALNAARGITHIEQAMGLKVTLTELIVELEKALSGEEPASQIDEERVRASEQIGARAREIEAELKKREGQFLGSEELRGYVVESQVALERSIYYQAESGLGVAIFKDFWGKASPAEREAMVLANEQVGITSEFAQALPTRGSTMLSNIVQATRLGSRINKTLDRKSVKQARKEIKAARKEEKATATAIAQAIDAKTEPGFVLADADADPEAEGDAGPEVEAAAETDVKAAEAAKAPDSESNAALADVEDRSAAAEGRAAERAAATAADTEAAAEEDECVSNSFMAAQNTARMLQGMLGNRRARAQARAEEDECRKKTR